MGTVGAEWAVPWDRTRVLVAGLGVTGRAVVDALAPRVAQLLTVDSAAPDADLRTVEQRDLDDIDLIVASPGWAPHHPALLAAAHRGIRIWSEVEVAWRLRVPRATGVRAPWLAVTGTNGKTTTVQMLSAILGAAGLHAPAVGNVGMPIVSAVLDPTVDVLAVELSSFQLHHTETMAAQAAAVLNVAADHLDWHGGMSGYAADKGRIYRGVERACVYAVADRRTEGLVRGADVVDGAVAVGFTLGAPAAGQVGLVDGILVDRAFHAEANDPTRRDFAVELATLGDLAHLGGPDGLAAPHVVANALAAAALARAHGVTPSSVRDGLRAFHPGAHRIETVAEVDGVGYIDDSKATNPHAAAAALGSYAPGSVVWIAGGLAKGATFDELVAGAVHRLRAVVLIGVDSGGLKEALARHAPHIPVCEIEPRDTGSVMTRAVHAAHTLASPGDTVLLAPACASMDQFADYAARGVAFARAVRELSP